MIASTVPGGWSDAPSEALPPPSPPIAPEAFFHSQRVPFSGPGGRLGAKDAEPTTGPAKEALACAFRRFGRLARCS